MSDDLFNPYDDEKQTNFVGVETVSVDFDLESSNSDTLFDINIKKDEIEQTFTRKVYTFTDLLSDLGGVSGVLSALGASIVTVFAQKVHNYSILSKLYQVDSEKFDNNQLNTANKDEVFEKSMNDKDQSQVKIDKNESNGDVMIKSNVDLAWNVVDTVTESPNMNKNWEENKHYEDSNKVDPNKVVGDVLDDLSEEKRKLITDHAIRSIQKRRRYNFTQKDLCFNVLWFCKWTTCRNKSLEVQKRRYDLYKIGLKKYSKELD